MAELSARERLYNEIYRTVKEHSAGMTRGEVQGVLVDIAGDIPSASATRPGREPGETLRKKSVWGTPPKDGLKRMFRNFRNPAIREARRPVFDISFHI